MRASESSKDESSNRENVIPTNEEHRKPAVKKPYSKPKLTEYGNLNLKTRASGRHGKHTDGGHGRSHKT